MMNLKITTESGQTILPTLNISYTCKTCGHVNELVRLNGAGKTSMELNSGEEHSSLCHNCDDVEKLTLKIY